MLYRECDRSFKARLRDRITPIILEKFKPTQAGFVCVAANSIRPVDYLRDRHLMYRQNHNTEIRRLIALLFLSLRKPALADSSISITSKTLSINAVINQPSILFLPSSRHDGCDPACV
ncbi:hypothetical protein H6F61_02565 [Cyanobacteria bacterium FACHB-472]|nr:hypothetical protein [Cyanobacteria bacterium FACHB-472]